jgi:hypothetical protein
MNSSPITSEQRDREYEAKLRLDLEDERPHIRRIAEQLLTVAREERITVNLAAGRLVNTSPGWRHSGAVAEMVRFYHADPDAFRRQRELDAAYDREVQQRELGWMRAASMAGVSR